MKSNRDMIALVDLDGTVADYDGTMREAMARLASPGEPPYESFERDREPSYIKIRRTMIQSVPGFWRNLPEIPDGMLVARLIKEAGFDLHVLTHGPSKTLGAWTEKAEWCAAHMPKGTLVTITQDKSKVYGRILFDDFPPYFEKWLAVRPHGLVICLAHPWNKAYTVDGPKERPDVFRFENDEQGVTKLNRLLNAVATRKQGDPWIAG